jgi:hypothetical protein
LIDPQLPNPEQLKKRPIRQETDPTPEQKRHGNNLQQYFTASTRHV